MLAPVLASLLAAALLAPAPAGAGEATPPDTHRIEHQGVVLEAAVAPLAGDRLTEGDHARVSFRFTDAHTGKPYPGLYPGAWLDRLPAAGDVEEDPCREKIEQFLGGSLLAQAEVDLNVYYVLALNDDDTITVVDPLFGFGTTKLLDLVALRGVGHDWALTTDGQRLFVSLPEWNRVAVVETATWDVALEIDTGPRPARVVLQPDGRYLWVVHDGTTGGTAGTASASGVTVIDARSLRRVADVATGPGAVDVVIDPDSRHAYVANRRGGTVSVIDVATLEKVRDLPAGEAPAHLAVSPLAGAVYAVDPAGGAVHVLDAERGTVAVVAVGPGLGELRFAPGGRLGFLVHPAADQVHLLDAATNRVVQTADVERDPDQVAFSDELAFVRHRGSDVILMIPLDEVGEAGRPVPIIDFPGGQHPAGDAAHATPAAGIVQAPGASAVLVANPADRAIYYYKEGMAAPMGHFKNYGRSPRAVLVVDRSLQETAPGLYETTVRLRRPGRYDLALFLDAPRVLACFPLQVAEDPVRAAERRRRPLEVELVTVPHEVAVGHEVRVRYRLHAAGGEGLQSGVEDVRALAFLAPGIWQQRQWAAEIEPGLYEAVFTPPEPGVYYVFVEIPSANLPFQRSPRLTLRAVDREGDPEQGPAREAAADGPAAALGSADR
ncbi:MAG TPA: YncE family protein [Thermoanaerobaculia bacterium]|nr:YncE family protein [Thermoanaerobaculia bacterium]